jgi:hypothetical protein
MHNCTLKFHIWWVLVVWSVGLLGSAMSSAQDIDNSGFQLVEEAIESSAVELVFNSEGTVAEIIANACDGCDRQHFLPARELEMTWGKDEIDLPTARGLNGRPATVIYNIRSKAATAVNFFKFGAEKAYEN